jgi:hypothetical protein
MPASPEKSSQFSSLASHTPPNESLVHQKDFQNNYQLIQWVRRPWANPIHFGTSCSKKLRRWQFCEKPFGGYYHDGAIMAGNFFSVDGHFFA